MFSTVWQNKENEEEGKLGRKFSLLSPQFSSSQIGRKMIERKVLSLYFYTNTSFWNRERERERESCAYARTFLNEEEKENKRRGIEIGTTCVEEKKKKKRKEKRMNEMKVEKEEII